MAEEKTFSFEILTLQKSFLSEQIIFVVAPGQEGVFEVLAHHAPFVFALKPGPLRLKMADGADRHLAVGGGILVVQRERTIVLTRSAEAPEEIDVARAERARSRAEERLRQRATETDVARAQAALARALARVRVAAYAKPRGG